ESARGIELLHASVEEIGHVDAAGRIDTDACRRAELARAGAVGTPLGDERAVARELLHAIVVRLGDVDEAARGHRDARGIVELPVPRTLGSPLPHVVAVGTELLDPRISIIGDVDRPVSIEGDPARSGQLTVARTETPHWRRNWPSDVNTSTRCPPPLSVTNTSPLGLTATPQG